MPEISRFYGVIIRMFMEPKSQHHRPNFHAYYQNFVAVVGIDEIELLAGELPKKELRLVFAWAELHRTELLDVWDLLQQGNLPFRIQPLA